MLYTYIHHKEYQNASWDVAHLYEHLVTRSFQSYLESLGLHPGLIGHVSGDTFEHIVFLNATFYDKRVADAYEHFLTAPKLIDLSITPQALLEIETEERITLGLQDQAKFDVQLEWLIEKPWINNTSISSGFINETTNSTDVFLVKRTAKEFRDVTVGIYADTSDLDNDEQTLLLRLSVVAGDMIDFAIRKDLQGTYYVGSSPISKDDTIMGNMHHIRFKRNIPLEAIKETAEKVLQTIDIPAAMPLISSHFKEFADRATWKSVVIDYYRHTGILTNNANISSLATLERVTALLSKLKVHVRAMRKEDEEWFS